MGILIGSARHDENGKLVGGKVGDQLQTGIGDLKGECSMQEFYIHSKLWFVLRPINKKLATDLAFAMATACNNPNFGYSQNCQRKTVDDITSLIKLNVDCSKLIRDCIYYASKKDVGNFTTANEVAVLEKSGLFEKHFAFKSHTKTPLYNGDVLVTQTKGHTVIVVSGGVERPNDGSYYPKYTGSAKSIVTALHEVGEKDTSFTNRHNIGKANGIINYTGTATQNTQLLKLLKNGKLLRV